MPPAGNWRYQFASVDELEGPYADLSYWSFFDGCWQLGPSWPPYLFVFPEYLHPEASQDVIETFLPPEQGVYAVMSAIQPGESVRFSLTQGQANGDDALLAVSPEAVTRKWGVLRLVPVTRHVTANSGTGQLHFRINALGDNGNDGTGGRFFLARLGTEPVPAGYSTRVEDVFGTGSPVPYGEGLGQLGDRDGAGNPVWFYQAGMPGQATTYELLADWEETFYSSDDASSEWGGCVAGQGYVHPGPDEAHSTIVTWCSPYTPMKAAISCTASVGPDGDGVLVRIYKNDDLLPGCTLDLPANGGGSLRAVCVDMAPGDRFHVAVSPKGDSANDSTTLSVTVTGRPPPGGTLVIVR
jgi:hypothetical protein